MGLVLKHVERTKSGSLQYRRRVPKDVSANITKREFKRKLGDSEREALAAYPAYHAQVEREIEAARRKAGSAGAAPATDLEAYTLARQQVRDMAASGFTRGTCSQPQRGS